MSGPGLPGQERAPSPSSGEHVADGRRKVVVIRAASDPVFTGDYRAFHNLVVQEKSAQVAWCFQTDILPHQRNTVTVWMFQVGTQRIDMNPVVNSPQENDVLE